MTLFAVSRYYRIIEKWLLGIFRLIISVIKTGSYRCARSPRFAACNSRSDVILLSCGGNGTKITRTNAHVDTYIYIHTYTYIHTCICHLVLNAEKCSVCTTGKVLHVSQGVPAHVELIDSQRRRRRRRRETTTMTRTGTRTCHGHTLTRLMCICIRRGSFMYMKGDFAIHVGGRQLRTRPLVKFKCDANVADANFCFIYARRAENTGRTSNFN